MVIACPECSTKFRVDPDRIPARGAKVRCARCKHVFLAQKTVLESIAEESLEVSNPAVTAAPEEPSSSFSPVPESSEPETEAFSAIEEDLTSPSVESDFNYDQFRDLDQTPQEEENFAFSEDLKIEQETADQVTAENDFSFGGESDEPIDRTETSEPADLEEPATVATASIAEEIAQELAAESTEVEKEELPEPVSPPPASPKSSPLSGVIRVLVLLILGLLILAGAFYYINGPEQFEQTIQQLLGKISARPTPNGQIALDKLEGKFLKNEEVGELFVIRGEAINHFRESRASIQVKGIIFDHNGKSLLQKTIFCGNPISDQELQSLPFSKIEELMGNQFGKSLSNMNVNAEQAIPFTIVFRDLPKSLAEFSVNIASSKPATQ